MSKPILKINKEDVYQMEHYIFKLTRLFIEAQDLKLNTSNDKQWKIKNELLYMINNVNIIRNIIEIPNEEKYVAWNIRENMMDLSQNTFYTFSSAELVCEIFNLSEDKLKKHTVKEITNVKKYSNSSWAFMKYNQYLKCLCSDEILIFDDPLSQILYTQKTT